MYLALLYLTPKVLGPVSTWPRKYLALSVVGPTMHDKFNEYSWMGGKVMLYNGEQNKFGELFLLFDLFSYLRGSFICCFLEFVEGWNFPQVLFLKQIVFHEAHL